MNCARKIVCFAKINALNKGCWEVDNRDGLLSDYRITEFLFYFFTCSF